MIHELTHVWQFEVTGPFYMSEAIHAQVLGAGYNYGYKEGDHKVEIEVDYAGNKRKLDAGKTSGFDGEQALKDAKGNFGKFNREQQGQITMHYFVRKVLLNEPPAEYADYEPYINVVRAA